MEIELNDFAFEEDLKNQPYNIQKWLFYIQSKLKKATKSRYLLYERALVYMPGSYKLWYRYLVERVNEAYNRCITDRLILETNNTFERALSFMHKMPRIWMMYGKFLIWQRLITRTRKTFDKSLISLPITQHYLIWPLYLKFVKIIKVPETSLRIYRRYIQLNPNSMEIYIRFLEKQGLWDEVANKLAWMVNEEKFISKEKKTKLELWKRLCNIMCQHSNKIITLNVDSIIRSGIRKYPQEVGYLWNLLATYYIRCSLFERSYDIFEEAINNVTTVRDFIIVYESYIEFQTRLIQLKLNLWQEKKIDITSRNDEILFDISSPIDIDLIMDRLENLQSRRDILLSSVKLRQNPHNVKEWINRVRIYIAQNDFNGAADVFATACNTVIPSKATGKYCQLWISFAKFYEDYDDQDNRLNNARDIFHMAVKRTYKGVDELSTIYCEWVEMELRHRNFSNGWKILRMSAKIPTTEQKTSEKVQDRLWKSTKLWCFLADLEESLGTLEDVKKTYNAMINLKVATIHNVLNYANILWNNNYFEESFKAYERGIYIFRHPEVMTLWFTYIQKFLERYSDDRLERARELFEQAISSCPIDNNKQLYLMYARLEEDRGLARRAMSIYDQAIEKVSKKETVQIYKIYLKRASDLFGVLRCREIYEKAIQNLPDIFLPEFCLRYINLEKQLGEIDRARGIFFYGSQFADPDRFFLFWEKWELFEVDHGNEETFKEMLRIKRTVSTLNTKPSMKGFIHYNIKKINRENSETSTNNLENSINSE